jgi:hypothetical protein
MSKALGQCLVLVPLPPYGNFCFGQVRLQHALWPMAPQTWAAVLLVCIKKSQRYAGFKVWKGIYGLRACMFGEELPSYFFIYHVHVQSITMNFKKLI